MVSNRNLLFPGSILRGELLVSGRVCDSAWHAEYAPISRQIRRWIGWVSVGNTVRSADGGHQVQTR